MEAPASLVFAWFFFTGSNDLNATCWALFALWQMHYVHRAFIFPFQIRVPEGHKTSIETPFVGGAYCAINGGLNGYFIGTLSQYDNAWLGSWQFILGVSLFFFGYFINKQSDYILKNLRKPGETGYKVPYGGAYRFVSSPNYMGEMITWIGFALAAWSLPALSFAYFTAANLIPRAVLNHRWYKRNFADYPKNRKAIIPFIL
jgi:protein-S-isoprenylcysteine O-methyltransferase Ste14